MKFKRISDMVASDGQGITATFTRPVPTDPFFLMTIRGLLDKDLKLTYSIAGGEKVIFLPTEGELAGAKKDRVCAVVQGVCQAFNLAVRFQNSRSLDSTE